MAMVQAMGTHRTPRAEEEAEGARKLGASARAGMRDGSEAVEERLEPTTSSPCIPDAADKQLAIDVTQVPSLPGSIYEKGDSELSIRGWDWRCLVLKGAWLLWRSSQKGARMPEIQGRSAGPLGSGAIMFLTSLVNLEVADTTICTCALLVN